ncbi:MAG: T9SS type A sorting domain-containing protein [Bacteroidota bacterium]
MKSKNLLFSFVGLSVIISIVLFSAIIGNPQKMYHPRSSEQDQEIEGAMQWLGAIRNNQLTGTINPIDVMNARQEITELIKNKSIGMQWNEAGPNNIGGRTRAILIDRNNSNLIYCGGVSGGLFRSTTGGTSWEPLPGLPDVNIASIAQNPLNGNLYVGTGESFANVDYVAGTPGFIGSGLYESTDGGETWQIFHNAKPTATFTTSIDWAFVNRIAVDPVTGRIYAAMNRGLRYWDDATSAWINPVYLTTTIQNNANATCIDIGSDQTVALVIGNKIYISPGGTGNGDPHTFVEKTPSTSNSRIELAIAPSNPNYIYACIANTAGGLQAVYRSTNKGDNWTVIGPGGSTAFQLFGPNNQGTYDNCIAVHPTNPDKIYVGGLVIWEWHLGSSFAQVTTGSAEYDAHVDMHAIVFDKHTPSTFYLGSDGGVAKTTNNGASFITINKNLSITQFYAVACNGSTGIMGGTQDNSNPYVSGNDIVDSKKGVVLFGGDGGWAAFSLVNPDAFFGTMQNAGFWRSPDKGVTYQEAANDQFISAYMKGAGTPGSDGAFAPFVTPLAIWESFNDLYSPYQTWFVDTVNHSIGETLTVKSHNNRVPFQHVLTASDGNYTAHDTLYVQDIITSKFFVGLNNGIWMTFGPLQFQERPQWFRISTGITNPHTFSISKDGNYMYVGTISGSLYRISNILAITDSVSGSYNSSYCVVETKLIKSFGSQAVTSIGIDPNNAERIVVTLGNYGNTDYIYYCANALDLAPTFVSKQGTTTGSKLPQMPVYSAIIEMSNPNMVIIGTEYGTYATQDITKSAAQIQWTEENTGMAKVPVFMIRQQIFNYPGVSNYGTIYLGTHGKGFYTNNQYLGINDNSQPKQISSNNISVYPNPVVDNLNLAYTLIQKTSVTVKIYDLNGRVMKLVNLTNKPNGYNVETINCQDLSKGTYIIQLLEGNSSKTAKFVVTK